MTTSGFHILHLDDDALYLEQFAALMQKAALGTAVSVSSVDNVEEYFARLKHEKPAVVVLDIHIGGRLCGQEVAQKTKALAPDCLVFMCSDMKGIGLISVCLSSGADDFVFKGSDEKELALRLYGTWKLRALDRAALTPIPQTLSKGPRPVGQSMRAVATRLERLSASAVTAIHVRGESGTGKELVSDLLAAQLPVGTPLIRVNCGAIAPTLLESELFGHVRGAFTGALSDKAGLIEQANGGWLFLDEVATLPPPAQVALLRVLENQMVRRVGGTTEKQVKIRILSATNEPIETLIAEGKFRADLWQRLCEAVVELKPLRERMSEFGDLVQHFCQEMHGGPYTITESALEILASSEWRDGNIRELRNCLRAMTELAIGKMLTPLSIPQWLWDRLESRLEDHVAVPAESLLPASDVAQERGLTISWPDCETPTFEELTQRLLLAVVQREAFTHGKASIRHLSRVTSIPKSTLAVRLKNLVELKLIELDELARLVNVANVAKE